jgi:hypothetical protein
VGWLTMAQVVVVALIEGSLFVLFDLAEGAALPQLVTEQQVPAGSSPRRSVPKRHCSSSLASCAESRPQQRSCAAYGERRMRGVRAEIFWGRGQRL